MTRTPPRSLRSLLVGLALAMTLTACQEPAAGPAASPSKADSQADKARLLQLHQEMSLQANHLAHIARTVQPRSPLQSMEQTVAWRNGQQPRPADAPLAPGKTVSQVDLARRLGATKEQLELFAMLARDLNLLAAQVRSIRSSRSSQMLQAVLIQENARRAEGIALEAVNDLQQHAAHVATHLHASLTGIQPPSSSIYPLPPWITREMPTPTMPSKK